MKLSIIIVNYNVTKELIKCIESVSLHAKGNKYEIIVVENNPLTDLSKVLKKYKSLKYIRSPKNLGYSGGNNLGASVAKGKYLFFLNPDTEMFSGSIKELLELFSNKKVGIVAPLLFHKNKKPFKLQGSKKLTPLYALFSHSLISKIWSNNPIARKFWLNNIDKTKNFEAEAIPGTAFIISSTLFKKIGGFDENFFLYFEENDLCNRVKNAGFKILMSPSLKIIHLWEISTKKTKSSFLYFKKSRFYYFKKYYGFIPAILAETILRISAADFAFIIIIAVGAFLRFYLLSKLMIFISDQAWFYISARDLILTGKIPLVGITSSQVWLHQGPIWTYMLALYLFIFNFSPVSGAYLSIFFDLATIFVLYKLCSEFFSKKAGLIVSILYAASPLTIILSRMPYHTSPIPFLSSLLLLFTLKWIMKNSSYFPLIILLLALLYNFELAMIVMWFAIFFIFLFGLFTKKPWVKNLLHTKIIALSLLLFLLPMIPIIIFDLHHGFVQTLKYANWVISLKIIKPIFNHEISTSQNIIPVLKLFSSTIKNLVFVPNIFVSFALFILSYVYILFSIIRRWAKTEEVVLLFMFTIPFVGFVFNGVASDAYLPLLFPYVFLLISLLFSKLFSYAKEIVVSLVLIIVSVNLYLLLASSYFSAKNGAYSNVVLSKQYDTLFNDIKEGKIKDISGKNNLNYQYLLWELNYTKK